MLRDLAARLVVARPAGIRARPEVADRRAEIELGRRLHRPLEPGVTFTAGALKLGSPFPSALTLSFLLPPAFFAICSRISLTLSFLNPPPSNASTSSSQIAQSERPSARSRVTLRKQTVVLKTCRMLFIHVVSPRLK